MSIKEFTKAAKIFDSGKSGIYEMCKYDYPKVFNAADQIQADVIHDHLKQNGIESMSKQPGTG